MYKLCRIPYNSNSKYIATPFKLQIESNQTAFYIDQTNEEKN